MDTEGDCHVERVTRIPEPPSNPDSQTVTLAVSGMGCPTCATRVYNALMLVPGVLDVDVSLERALARVVFDAARIDGVDLVAAVAAAGSDGRHQYRGVLVPDQPS
jgi:copper chaperone CopZ